MGTVGLDGLKPGMVLASDLKSKQGRLLLPAGAALTEKHLRTCKVWGICEADIQGAPESAPEEELRPEDFPPEILQASKRLAAGRFRLVNVRHPAARILARMYVLRTAQELSRNGNAAKATAKAAAAPQTGAEPGLERVLHVDEEEIATREVPLSSLPDVFQKIIAALNDPTTSSAYLAEVIGKDTSLSARLLKLVNSPHYGFMQKIDTLSRALTMVGLNQITNLALGVSVMSMFEDIPSELMDMRSFWHHSLASAIICSLTQESRDAQGEERLFVCGLIHDIGRLVMLKLYPAESRAVLAAAQETGTPLHTLEKRAWGFTHASLGAALLEQWQFPPHMVDAVRLHHAPSACTRDSLAPVVHFADHAAHALDIGASGAPLVPPLAQEAWELMRIPANEVKSIVRQVDPLVQETMEAFFGSQHAA